MDEGTPREPNRHDHIHLPPDDHEDTPTELNSRGRSLQQHFKVTANLADISKAIAYHRKALHLSNDDDMNIPTFLDDLGHSLSLHFRFFDGDFSNITEAITLQQKAVQLTPDSHEEMPLRLNNLGVSLAARFWRSGDLSDISQAIKNQEKAVHLTAGSHKNMPTYLCDLGNSLCNRYARLDEVSDIIRATEYQQKAVDIAEDINPDLPRLLTALTISLRYRWITSADLSDISQAITYGKKVIDIASDGHAELPFCLSILGLCMVDRGAATGELSDICDAVVYQQKAILLTPDGHAYKNIGLNNLGGTLVKRFMLTGDLSDISEAITCYRKVMELTPKDHPQSCSQLSNLAEALQRRFGRLRDISDLSEAIIYLEQVIHIAPQGNLDTLYFLNQLGHSLLLRFKELNDISDLEKAIASFRKIVQLCPDERRNRWTYLQDLGWALQDLFEQTGNPTDISDSIMYQEQALHLAPDDAKKVHLSDKLVEAYKLRSDHPGNPTDLNSAMAIYRLATNFPGPPLSRLQAAEKWARFSRTVDPSQSLEAYKIAIDLMSQVAAAGLEQTTQKRHSNLVYTSDLTTSAAATAFEFGKPCLALEWLEQGRCVVWGQLNNLRTPLLIDALHGIHPSLSGLMARLSMALEQAGPRKELDALGAAPTVAQKMTVDEETSSPLKFIFVREWDQLLETVHGLPEFKDFLRPLSYSTLRKGLPKFGTVVVINVQQDRCDAIALNSGIDNALHIPLDNFSYTKAEDLRNRFHSHLRLCNVRIREVERDSTGRGMRYEGDISIKGVLHQLWEFVVKPILTGLGITDPPPELTRIWWCVTGPLAFLPIHAAGIYDDPAASCLTDFAFSSYTPTLGALIKRVKAPKIDITQKGLFMISQPNTPGMTPIPATVHEVRGIEKVLEDHGLRVMCLNGDNATISEGLSNMETYSCIHLACHATQEINYPLQSGFFLHDGRLDLGSIIQKRLIGADLAFLSACQTSAGNEKLSEEAVHLAAGMMAAGYRGVVATMWSTLDRYGPRVAEEFYRNLVSEGGSLDGEHAARALHYATQKLRKEIGDSESSLLAWVPYVHFGL